MNQLVLSLDGTTVMPGIRFRNRVDSGPGWMSMGPTYLSKVKQLVDGPLTP